MDKKLSVVIPCYNEQEVLPETYRRMTAVMQGIAMPYELVFVNDGSKDRTAPMLDELAAADQAVKVVHFARNGGHQIAVTAGLDYATGDAIVIIDADLQDPPEVIPQMLARWREGVDIVYGQRRSRKGESWLKEKTAKLYYWGLQKLAGDIFPRDTGDFRLVDKKVADVVRAMPERARYLRGMFAWAGFKQEPLLFDRDSRFAGETHYTLKKMVKLAGDGVVSFSNKPLSLALALGMGWLIAGGLTLLVLIISAIAGARGGLWWLATLIMLATGSLLACLGIVGRYLARVYDEVKGRPLYVVARTLNLPDKPTNI